MNRTLFQDRMDIWEEIETKVNSGSDLSVVKTPNKVGGSSRYCKCVSGCVVVLTTVDVCISGNLFYSEGAHESSKAT